MLNCSLGLRGPSTRESHEQGGWGLLGWDWIARPPPNQVVSGSSLQKHRNPKLETPRLSRLHQHPRIPNFANKEFYLIAHNLLRMGVVSVASADISSGYSASSSEEGLVGL